MIKKRELIPSIIKKDFPFFQANPNTVYLDNAATTLKPQIVIDKIREYYQEYSTNVFRGLYPLSQKATDRYEAVRVTVAKFLNAQNPNEIIFTRGTTESLNLVAYSWGKNNLFSKDEIAVLIEEHHANFVPWQQLASEKKAIFKVIGLNQNLETIVNRKTKLLAINYVSNVLGEIKDLKQIIKKARSLNSKIVVVVDAAQAAGSINMDVRDLDCDFLAFSGHKLMGPTGVGVLWGKQELLEAMPPFLFGGEMINEVSVDKTTFAKLPHKFEAGTPAIAQVIGLGAAINYLNQFDKKEIIKHEQELVNMAINGLKKNPKIRFINNQTKTSRIGILTFSHKNIHAHDLAEILGNEGVCVRAGHHCAMPLHQVLSVSGSLRLSAYLYNTKHDIQRFLEALTKAEFIFKS